LVEAPGVAPSRRQFQNWWERALFWSKLLKGATFDVAIDPLGCAPIPRNQLTGETWQAM
jgi:hypothetical protein